MIDKHELKEALAQFNGSEQYCQHKFLTFTIYITEGVRFLREKAQCYWLIDLVCSYQPSIKKEEFQVWNLIYKGEEKGWVIICTDGNDRTLVRQEIPFSDFPLEKFQLWLVDGVILLPGEY